MQLNSGRWARMTAGAAAGLTAVFMAGLARAQDGLEGLQIVGAPVDGNFGFQPAATKIARDVQWLDGFLLWIIVPITLFVTILLAIAVVRFNRRANPTPATFTHNSVIEVAWTAIPIVILVVIGAFSLPVLFEGQEIPKADVTIKATGNQWYWSYEYVDDGFAFDSYMIGSPSTGFENRLTPEVEAALIEAGYSKNEFLLATDTAVVVPVNKVVVVRVTGADVIHAWTVPAFGVKQDAVPGRTAELWFEAEREGIYFGQCSELCGNAHAYMPITVKVVSEAAYAAWLGSAKSEYASTDPAAQTGAAVDVAVDVAANN